MARAAAKGTLLELGDGAGSWTTVAQLSEIGGPQLVKGVKDVTGPADVAAGYRRHVETWREGGDVTLAGTFDPTIASHSSSGDGLLARFEGEGPQQWRITWPLAGSPAATFDATVIQLQPTAPVAGALGFQATLRISGAPTWS